MAEFLLAHAEIGLTGCTAELSVNDVPVALVEAETGSRFLSKPVSEYVLPGANRLTVIVNPDGAPAGPAGADVRVAARIAGFRPGDEPGKTARTAGPTVNWSVAVSAAASFPMTLHATRDMTLGLPAWEWAQCRRINRNASDFQDIASVLQRVHKAFERRAAEPIIELCRNRFEDRARAYPGMTADGWRADFAHDLETVYAGQPWKVAPLVRDEFDLRLCGDGRLIACIDRRRRPLIRAETRDPTSGEPVEFPFRMLLGFPPGTDRCRILR